MQQIFISFPFLLNKVKRWVDAQAHIPTPTKNSTVCSPQKGMSTTQPLQEVQVAAAG